MRHLLFSVLLLIGGLLPAPARAEPADALILRTGPRGPYRAAFKSLRRALPDELRVETLTLDPDRPQEDEEAVRAQAARVLVPLGSEATAWALAHTRETPIVFAMVLQPIQSGFARSFERPEGRITGAALDIPHSVHFRTLRELLRARKVGVLYNPEATGSLIDAARDAARRAGVELVAVPVPERSSLETALATLTGELDVLWSVPDPIVFGQGGVRQVLLHTLEQEIPFMGLSEHYVRAGALLALTTSLEENGRQAAERVIRVLAGESPGKIPIARPESVEVVFNAHVAKRMSVRVPSQARSLAP